MKKLSLLAAMLAIVLVGAVPALAQSTVIDEQEAQPPESDEETIRGTANDQGANSPGGNEGWSVRRTITDISAKWCLSRRTLQPSQAPRATSP